MNEERPRPPRPGPETTSASSTAGTRRQRGAFSIFFDAPPGAAEPLWETRIYHEESGEEVMFSGANPDRWLRWLLERIRESGDEGDLLEASGGGEVGAELELEASVAVRRGERRLAEALSLRLRIGVEGVDVLEHELGAALVRLVGSLADAGSAVDRPTDRPASAPSG